MSEEGGGLGFDFIGVFNQWNEYVGINNLVL